MKSLLIFTATSCLAFGQINLDKLTVEGREYTGVSITKTDALMAKITHSSGIKNVPMDKLPANIQDELGYDRDAAQDAKEEALKNVALQRALVELEQQSCLELRGHVLNILDRNTLLLSRCTYTNPNGTPTGLIEGAFVFLSDTQAYTSGSFMKEVDAVYVGTRTYDTAIGGQRTVKCFETRPEVFAKKICEDYNVEPAQVAAWLIKRKELRKQEADRKQALREAARHSKPKPGPFGPFRDDRRGNTINPNARKVGKH